MVAIGGVVKSAEAKQICGLSGLDQQIYRDKLITLEGLRKGLQQSIREANSAADSHRAWTFALVGAKIVKAACDVAIDVIGSKAGPMGIVVSKGYDSANMLVDTLNNDLDGGKVAQMMVGQKLEVVSHAAKGLGKQGLEEAAGAAKTLMNASVSAIDIYKTAEEGRTGASGIEGSTKTMIRMLEEIDGKIARLEGALAGCG